MSYALASEYNRLTPAQRDSVTHIICDDGEWTESQIANYIATTFTEDIEIEKREGWSKS